jgi:hypothetical protein
LLRDPGRSCEEDTQVQQRHLLLEFSFDLHSRELEDAGVIEAPEGGFTTEQMGQFVDTKIAKLTDT